MGNEVGVLGCLYWLFGNNLGKLLDNFQLTVKHVPDEL